MPYAINVISAPLSVSCTLRMRSDWCVRVRRIEYCSSSWSCVPFKNHVPITEAESSMENRASCPSGTKASCKGAWILATGTLERNQPNVFVETLSYSIRNTGSGLTQVNSSRELHIVALSIFIYAAHAESIISFTWNTVTKDFH